MAKDKQKFQKDCLLYRQFFEKLPRMKPEKTFNIGMISKTKGNVHLMKSSFGLELFGPKKIISTWG